MPELLTTAQVAAQLNITPSGVSRMVARGTLEPARKAPGIRGAYFFTPEAVAQAQAQRAERVA